MLLDDFFRDPDDDLAWNLAKKLAGPVSPYTAAVFIGAPGTGKTHLLKGIIEHLSPSVLVSARVGDTLDDPGMLKRFQTGTSVLVDDIDALPDLAALEPYLEEAAFRSDKPLGRLILSTTTSLRKLTAPDRVRTRLSWLVRGNLPRNCLPMLDGFRRDFPWLTPALTHILREKCQRVSYTFGEVYAALRNLDAFRELGVELADWQIRELQIREAPAEVERIAPDAIIDHVCQFYRVTRHEINSPRRFRRVAEPRHVAMYLVRKHTPLTLTEIGGYFGGRDHSTVMHAVNKIETAVREQDELRREINHHVKILIGETAHV